MRLRSINTSEFNREWEGVFKQKNNIALAVIKVSNKRFWNIDRERNKKIYL